MRAKLSVALEGHTGTNRGSGTVDISRRISGAPTTFANLSTHSKVMRELFETLTRLAPTRCNLVLEGETGVGKEVIAEAFHQVGPRASGPFVVFDCVAKSATVVERELFGYEPERTLGSSEPTAGVFEQANAGTLVLDHIDALPLYLQAQLLRAVEKQETRRVGSTLVRAFDLRIIAVSNSNLGQEVRLGTFRADLYERLGDSNLRVPALRQRLEDLSLLAESFLAECVPARTVGDIPAHLWSTFYEYRWPGNIREFRNALQRALVLPGHAF